MTKRRKAFTKNEEDLQRILEAEQKADKKVGKVQDKLDKLNLAVSLSGFKEIAE